MLLPLFVCCVMALYGAFALWHAAWSRGWNIFFQVLACLVAAVCLVWYIPKMQEKVVSYHKGDGLTAFRWRDSQIVQAVSALPQGQPVISNNWQLLLLWTGRPIYGLWLSFPKTVPIQIGPYGTLQGDTAQVVFCSQGAALVVFNDFSNQFRDRFGEASVDRMLNLFVGLPVYGTYPDGTIYLCR
jgi:hypothetical protein